MTEEEYQALMQRLGEEAQSAIPEAPSRTWGQFFSHPGVLTHRPKLPEQRLQDLRDEFVIQRLAKESGVEPAYQAAMAKHLMDAGPGLRSPEEYTGVLGAGSGLRNAADWMQAVPAMAYEASGMLANAADDVTRAISRTKVPPVHVQGYGDRFKNIMGHANTALQPLGLQRANRMDQFVQPGNLPSGSVESLWERKDRARRSGQDENAVEILEGADHLRDYNVQDLIGDRATQGLGLVMDSVLSPFGETKGAYTAARAGRNIPAWTSLASEYAPLGALTGYQMYLEDQANRKDNPAPSNTAGGRNPRFR